MVLLLKNQPMNRKKTIDGMDIIEYLYECQNCNYTHWADSKKLFMRCPKCFLKKINSRLMMSW